MFFLRGWAGNFFNIQWGNSKVFFTASRAVEMHEMHGNIF